jgi:integrase
MSAEHPTAPTAPVKPCKPRPDFPLGPHPSGYWCKKIRGQLHYFGARWKSGDAASALAAADAALEDYNRQADALHSGRKPRPDPDALTVKGLCNQFLNAKQAAVEAGELSSRTWDGYKDACDLVVKHFGKSRLVSDLRPDDFTALRTRLAAARGPHWLGNTIQYIRSAFKFAFDTDLIDLPVRFGPGFKRPSKKTFRVHKAQQGPKLFTASEVRAMAQGALIVGEDGPEPVQAGVQLRAMILLGINCGFGNADCGNLTLSTLDLNAAMIDYPRPKTGINRRCPLWPETVEALRGVLAERKEPKDPADAGLVFVTRCGQSWARADDPAAITKEFAKLLRKLGISGRKGLGFYTLRHVFRTVADESKDQPAADFIMGHEVPHMSSVYRETISDARLRAVVEQVHVWLFPRTAATTRETTRGG